KVVAAEVLDFFDHLAHPLTRRDRSVGHVHLIASFFEAHHHVEAEFLQVADDVCGNERPVVEGGEINKEKQHTAEAAAGQTIAAEIGQIQNVFGTQEHFQNVSFARHEETDTAAQCGRGAIQFTRERQRHNLCGLKRSVKKPVDLPKLRSRQTVCISLQFL